MLLLRRGCLVTRNILYRQCIDNARHNGLKSLCAPESMPKYIKGFNDIPELENANDMVKKIFSLEFASHHDMRRVAAEVYTAEYETKLEKNIVNATHHIRILTERMIKNKKDRQTKEFLIWLVDQRKKNLKKLVKEDVAKYESIIEKFEIPPLQSPFEPQNKYKFRKYKINVPLKKRRDVTEFEDAQVY